MNDSMESIPPPPTSTRHAIKDYKEFVNKARGRRYTIECVDTRAKDNHDKYFEFDKLACSRYWSSHRTKVVVASSLAMWTITATSYSFGANDFDALEQDPTISLSYVSDADAQVPTAELFYWSAILPIVFIFVVDMVLLRMILPYRERRPTGLLLTWFMFTIALAMAMTVIVKVYVGRPRPNFFALCDYMGYREIADGNNDTALQAFLDNTIPLRKANTDMYCEADKDDWNPKAWTSFPSGHSSISAAGLGFLACYCSSTVKYFLEPDAKIGDTVRQIMVILFSTILPFICLSGALLVASTRVTDHWHHPSDVAAGTILGAVCVAFAAGEYFFGEQVGPVFKAPDGNAPLATEIPRLDPAP
eukprot:g1854.t1